MLPLPEALESRFAAGVDVAWGEEEFTRLALAGFRYQFESIPAYRGFCERRRATPDTVSAWADVPAVPATAFKHVDLAASEPQAVFCTSGTTRGDDLRGRHSVPWLSLYRASLLPPFRKHVMAGCERIRFVSLIPPPRDAPDSSLSFMVGAAAEAFATETHWLVDGAGRLDEAELASALRGRPGEPVLLLGTALALLHALERWEEVSPLEPLPSGSRIMETGGFKGSRRETTRADLHARLSAATRVPLDHIVNEYGMTELLSQLYEPVLTEGAGAAGLHEPPPWLRVRAVDPITLDELGPGEAGLLAFFDLANVGSVCHILTEDVGSVAQGRVTLQGRLRGAEPRGCSRAIDELMSAAGLGGATS